MKVEDITLCVWLSLIVVFCAGIDESWRIIMFSYQCICLELISEV